MLVAVSMASKNKFQKAVVKSNNTTVEEEPKPESEYLDEDGDQKEDEEEEDDGELNLDDVLLLGGKKSDFLLLSGINDNHDLIDGGKKGAIDDLEPGELEKFITKLGVRAYASLQTVADDDEFGSGSSTKKKKDKKAPAGGEPSATKAAPKANGEPAVAAETKKPKKTKELAAAGAGVKKAKQSADVFEFHQRSLLLIKPGGKWFDLEYTTEGCGEPQDEAQVAAYKALAARLYEAEEGQYRSKKSLQKGANSAWMKTVVSKGTLVDRMAAMTVLLQDAPVHGLQHVESLIAMVKKKGGRRMGLMALDTLRELLLSELLPADRKLRSFAQHPFDTLEERASGNRDSRDRRLILWFFEHRLKALVAEFVVALEEVSRDSVAATKSKALATAHELLSQRPEQEKALLVQVVNKLGDPEYKMAARASHLLETLLHRHPNMKAVVCGEVERLMFRPNISGKAQYYAVCFLSQVLLSHEEAELAGRLISVYFTFFRACIKKADVESKMLGALLSGVNRAYPYAVAGDDKVKEQLDTLFKVVHAVKFNTAVQALMLLFQVMDSQQSVSDRYYVALYKKLLDPGLSACSRQSMFLNLLYKSLKADVVLRRVRAFVKRLLQVSCEQNATFACGALFLVSEVMKAKPGLRLMLQENEAGDEENFKDLAEEEEEDDEEERFVDADKVVEEETKAAVKEEDEEEDDEEKPVPEKPKPKGSWVHHQNLEGGKKTETYDPLHRNPMFCGADRTTLWELQQLSLHFHPSVSLFAKTILQGDSVQYTGDPLQDFTLIRFLDRFVFRNPKQLKGKQNTEATVMRPQHKLAQNKIRSLAVNCKEFLDKDESQIPVDQVFFHRYFKKRAADKFLRRPPGGSDTESLEDVEDDEFERILDSVEGDSYYTDLGDVNLDFAGNVKTPTNESGSDDSDLDDLDDDEISLGSLDEEDFGDEMGEEGGTFVNDEDDDDEEVPELEEGDDEDFAFDDSEEEEGLPEATPPSKKNKRKAPAELDFSGSIGPAGGKRKRGRKDAGLFTSAEEFGSMLDENAGSKFDNIGMNAMANKDKAGLKQLKWESKRDDWVHGRDAQTLRKKKTAFNKKKDFVKAKVAGKAKMAKKVFKKKK
ncbi:CCAAT/enhancer-binding protein zeta [Gadus morhua]|uniref:CCAAT/enhancer-binding protein zeta n=1 Tax=Gadus morhua TaxID=8049 RepID=A0A8C5F9J7_GADMO|nr:CCAAT/enhancer-binding protein zeta [Gadus morhua]